MYTELKLKSKIRVPPHLFGKKIAESVEESVRTDFEGVLDLEEGLFLGVIEVLDIGDGVIVAGDGAVYYDVVFTILAYKPVVQEVVEGIITEIAEFGAFAKIGPIEGLIHKSQIMDDFVSYSKTGSMAGKDSNRVLKVGDKIRARVIAANLKNLQTAKVGLTMRQEGMGVLSWFEKKVAPVKKASKKKEAEA
ncbi:MAG: DNA-directed RNA polymerase [Candidatus Nanoarchaeia archaeon]|jgi:DNA-directed RNA polymerase subunit E'